MLFLLLKQALTSTDEYVVTYSKIRARESAQNYQVTNVKNRFKTYKNAVKDDEQEYIEKGTDVISIGSKIKPPLLLLSEKSGFLKWVFRKKPRAGQVNVPSTQYWSYKGMEAFSDSIIILAGLLMLYGPLWWLNWVSDDTKRLGIITGFVGLFAIGLRLISGAAKPFEVLAATAA